MEREVYTDLNSCSEPDGIYTEPEKPNSPSEKNSAPSGRSSCTIKLLILATIVNCLLVIALGATVGYLQTNAITKAEFSQALEFQGSGAMDRGPQGPQGEAGIPGPPGITGSQGEPGTTGATGEAGNFT